MITSDQAQRIICDNWISPQIKSVDLSDCLGMVLAESVHANRHSPSFDRVAMDGISLLFSTIKFSDTYSLSDSDSCMEVSTGQVLASNHDTVIPYEQVDIKGGVVSLRTPGLVKKGQHVHCCGDDYKSGQVLLSAGTKISSTHIGLLASNGNSMVNVYGPYRIAVISSGNELIDVGEDLEHGKVYKSNIYSIKSELHLAGQRDIDLFHFRDCKDEITRELSVIVDQYDLVFISGGVSKGKDDFIPRALPDVGVKTLFHYVRHRPGKPFLFGRGAKSMIFGLPGNPVASMICFKRYVMHLLKSGRKATVAKLDEDVTFSKALTCYKLVQCESRNGELFVSPQSSSGSADLLALSQSDGFIELDLERKEFFKGELFAFYCWE